MKLSFTTKTWNGDLRNFGKEIQHTVDVRIDGKRQAIIFIPKDGSKPKTMNYTQEGYPPGIISGKPIDDIIEKAGLPEMMKKVYGLPKGGVK